MIYINKEILRIIDKLSKNENKNILYYSKYTKFKKRKFNIQINNNIINHNINITNKKNKIQYSINDIWPKNKGENCL